MAKIRIHKELCKQCGLCVEVCPEQLFTWEGKGSFPKAPRQKGCISCGHCANVCPNGAIEHEDFPAGNHPT